MEKDSNWDEKRHRETRSKNLSFFLAGGVPFFKAYYHQVWYTRQDIMSYDTLWLFNIAMENGPFIDGLPIKNGDFPRLC